MVPLSQNIFHLLIFYFRIDYILWCFPGNFILVFLSSLFYQMNISPCGVKFNTFEIRMQKRVHITLTAIYPDCIFVLRYHPQFLNIMCLGTVHILPPYRFNWVNEPWNTAFQYHPPQNKVSLAWCQLCDIRSSVHYCNDWDLQSSNLKILSLSQCQRIYALCAIIIST